MASGTIGSMVREPTVKSLFFWVPLAALFIAGSTLAMHSFVIGQLLVAFGVFLLIPIVISLYVGSPAMVTTLSLVVFLTFVFILAPGGGLNLITMGILLPVMYSVDRFSGSELGSCATYCLFYISIGPLFALTCRRRQPQVK